jgi:hypothetical protein
VGPNHPTALLRDAKQQFKSIGHFGLRIYLEACATGRIVNNVAINNGSLRANDYFGLGTLARRANASKVSRIHLPVPIDHLETHLADSQTIFKISFQFMVSEIHRAVFKRNTSCGIQTRRIVQLRDVRSADLELWFVGEGRAWAVLGSAVSP